MSQDPLLSGKRAPRPPLAKRPAPPPWLHHPIRLQKRQTGDKEVPKALYAQEVAQLVLRLEDKDKTNMAQVNKFSGFTENAYRYIFAYEEKFPEVQPRLQTILPSGKIENAKNLVPEKERGIIAYTYSQKMTNKKTAQLLKVQGSHFVFERDGEPGEPYVLQTWPTRFNDKFKKEFKLVKYPSNPDPEHFKEEALEDFKRVALRLFQRPLDEDPPLWLGSKKTENRLPMYQGTGKQLMALLRLRKDIREELRIKQILEPDGFVSMFTDGKNNEGDKPFHMDLSGNYALYQKQGWETMACPKPLAQFDFEAERYPQAEIHPAPASGDGVISLPLDMEWVCGPAYVWAWRASAVVWGGAVFTVTFAYFFYNRADWWEKGAFSDFWQHLANTITGVIITSAVFFGLYADNKAMSYCMVPWLQNVEKSCMIPFYGKASCNQFRCFSLLCTLSQMLTIQLNAWVLANTIRTTRIETDLAWEWLWEEGGVGWCPLKLTHTVLVLWSLSTLQLIVPSLYSLMHFVFKKNKNISLSIPREVNVVRDIGHQTYKFRCRSFLKGSLTEGVTLMALASGMRYTGAVSLSYPLAMIKNIKKHKIGFMVKTEGGQWEQTQHGWRFRCVKELQKMYSFQVKRICFLLVIKYALQMNVQVTLFVLKGTLSEQNKQEAFNYAAAVGELVSLGAMTMGIAAEFYDLTTLLLTFRDVRSIVCDCLDEKKKADEEKKQKDGDDQGDVGKDGMQDALARHFFKGKDGTPQEETLTYADLKNEYVRILVVTVCVVMVSMIAMWFIGYQIMKFVNYWRCPDHVWSFKTGCLTLQNLTDYLENRTNRTTVKA